MRRSRSQRRHTPGSYHYGACVDPVSGESDTTNNCSDTVAVTVLPPPPDLSVEGLTVDVDSLVAHQPFTLSVTVWNQGTGSSNTTTLRYYRSDDSNISSGDDNAGRAQIPALDASGISHASITIAAPPTPGVYHYGACIVPVPGEPDTTNNCSHAVAVTVSPTPLATMAVLPPLLPDFAALVHETSHDGRTRQDIDALKSRMPEAAQKIEELPWVKDGIRGVEESGAVSSLLRLFDVGYGESLISEPWVVEGSNYPAVLELARLSWDSERFDKVMAYPAIIDGITEREAKILATLGTIAYPVEQYLMDHNLLDKLLDPDQAIIEERTIALPLAGRTELTLVRTVAGDPRTMDFVEHSVRRLEEFMGFPFPLQHVIFVFVDTFGGGKNFGSHISMNIKNEPQMGQDVQGRKAESWLRVIAHETAHHYWKWGPVDWLFEGAATFMELAVSDELHLTPEDAEALLIERKFSPCTLVNNLSELEALPTPTAGEKSFEYYDCQYLGGSMFLYDLYHALDDATFRQAFRRVYLHTQWTGECGGESVMSICHVQEAFRTHVSEEEWPAVEAIFDRRYGPTDPKQTEPSALRLSDRL